MRKIVTRLFLLLFVIAVATAAKAQTYCAPSFSNGCYSWHNNSITIAGGINWTYNASDGCAFSNYTSQVANVGTGTPINCTVVNNQYCGCAVWVDFNSDGDFDDAGESLYTQYVGNATNTYTFTITIPTGTPTGSYRLRVVSPWGSDGTPGGCAAFQYGNYDDFTINVGTCDVPTNLAASAITATTATLSWDMPTGSTNGTYVIDNSSIDPTVTGTSFTGTSYSYNASALTNSTTYYLHVHTVCGSANMSAWVTIPFTTLPPCVPPTGLAVSNIGTTTADLSWTTSGTGNTYEYVVDQLSTDPTGAGTAASGTTVTASGLSAGVSYYAHVRSQCDVNLFSAWTTVPFTTLPPCNAPGGLTATAITTSSATVSWSTVNSAAGFEYAVDQNTANPASGTAVTGTSYPVGGLFNGTTYYLHVRTSCGVGDYSAWSVISFVTDTPPCSTPASLTISNVSNTGATGNWPTVSGANGYQYAIDQSASDPAPSTAVPTSSSNFTVNNLSPGNAYYAHVRGDCGSGNFSGWITQGFSTTTLGVTTPTANAFMLQVAPNPVGDELSITVTGGVQEPASIQLTDVTGKLMASIQLDSSNAASVNMGAFPAGVYFVRYADAVRVRTIKVQKQ